VEEPTHIISPGEVEVFEREAAFGDSRPAGGKAERRVAAARVFAREFR